MPTWARIGAAGALGLPSTEAATEVGTAGPNSEKLEDGEVEEVEDKDYPDPKRFWAVGVRNTPLKVG